jgi:RNA polymerase sigma-70 factor (ECF subfamily)
VSVQRHRFPRSRACGRVEHALSIARDETAMSGRRNRLEPRPARASANTARRFSTPFRGMIEIVEVEQAEVFRQHGSADEDLAQQLVDAHRRGREAWPSVELDATTFIAHLARKLSSEVSLDSLAIEDLYLACALAHGNAAAIRVLEREFLPQLAAVLARRGLCGDSIEELAQALREHLIVGTRARPGRIADYGGRGALRSFIVVAAVRMSHRAGERERRRAPLGSLADMRDADVDDVLAKGEYREPLERACEHVLRELPQRERALLRLQLVDGATIDQIGRIYGVHRATAARWLARARAMIRDRTRERLAAVLGIDESRAASIADLVHSQIDLSVARLLRTAPS